MSSTMCPIAHRSLARRIGRKKRGVSRPRARREGTPSPRAPRRAVGIRTSGVAFTCEIRKPRASLPASSNGRTADFGSAYWSSNLYAGAELSGAPHQIAGAPPAPDGMRMLPTFALPAYPNGPSLPRPQRRSPPVSKREKFHCPTDRSSSRTHKRRRSARQSRSTPGERRFINRGSLSHNREPLLWVGGTRSSNEI